jgi:hypothetical protein
MHLRRGAQAEHGRLERVEAQELGRHGEPVARRPWPLRLGDRQRLGV